MRGRSYRACAPKRIRLGLGRTGDLGLEDRGPGYEGHARGRSAELDLSGRDPRFRTTPARRASRENLEYVPARELFLSLLAPNVHLLLRAHPAGGVGRRRLG